MNVLTLAENLMRDMIEGLAICLSVGMVFMPLIGFVLFTRYINRKEKAALREFNNNGE